MALIVLCDQKYRHGAWCDTKIRGIMDEASRRRIQPQIYTNISAAKELALKCDEDTSVILLFDSMPWLCEAVKELSECRTHIILSANYIDIALPAPYSMVGTDIDAAMRSMLDYLRSCGKRHIALVGVNPASCNDNGRAAMLKKYMNADDYRIFYAEDNMMVCFDEFLAVQNSFDAAICTNDLLAICLSEHLKAHPRSGDKLFIISHTDTVMAKLYGEGITSMTVNFYDCGRILVETHFNRLKYGFARSVNLLPAQLKVRGSTDNKLHIPSKNMPVPMQQPSFFEPKAIRLPTRNVSKLERILASSDLTNLKLMYCLLCGFNYERMSEFCFISAETARYRVRKIRNALGVQKKAEAADILREYIKKESLLAIIGEQEEKNNQIIV